MTEIERNIERILENEEEVFHDSFSYIVPDEDMLRKAEARLGFRIPEQYLWFMKKYGSGGLLFDFLGFDQSGNCHFADVTEEMRLSGLPDWMLVIEDCGEFVNAIDVRSGKVISFSPDDGEGAIEENDTFCDYFLECIVNALEQ